MLCMSPKALLAGFLLATLLPVRVAATTLAETLTKIPDCAAACITSAVLRSTCSATNQTCVCTNQQLNLEATICVVQSCTNRQTLFTRNVTETACGAIPRDVSGQYITISNALLIIASLMVVQRLANNFIFKIGLWLDDLFIAFTLFGNIGFALINVRGLTSNGLGRDIWTVPQDNISPFLIFFYSAIILYIVELGLLRLAMLFFYLRIFQEGSKKTRYIILATGAFVVSTTLLFLGLAIGMCRPLSHFWFKWDGEHAGTCLNFDAIIWSHTIINLVLDAWMLAIPLFEILKLRLDWKRKIAAAIMFSLGFFLTAVSLLRFNAILKMSQDQTNPTWRFSSICKWSEMEIAVGIICTCMPSLRKLFGRLMSKLFKKPSTPTQTNYDSRPNMSRAGLPNDSDSASRSIASQGQSDASGTIVVSRTFTIEYETDEMALVDMKDLHTNR